MGKKGVSSSRKKRGYPRPAPERLGIDVPFYGPTSNAFTLKYHLKGKLVNIARDVGHKNLMALKFFFKWADSDVVECVTSNGELWEKIGASIKKSHMVECYVVEEVVSPTNETWNLTQDGVDLGNGAVTQGPVLDGQIDNGGPYLGEGKVTQDGLAMDDDLGVTNEDIGSGLEAEKWVVSGEPVGPKIEEIGSALEAEIGVVSGEPVGPAAEEIGTGLEEFLPCFEAEIGDLTTEAVRLGNKEINGEHKAEKIARDDDFVAAAMEGFDTFGMGNGEESDYDEELYENNDVAAENVGTFEVNNGPANEDSEDDSDPDYIMDEEEEEETNDDNKQREGKRHVDFDVDEVVVESDGEKIVFESSSSDIESEIEETNEFHTRKRKSKRARMPHYLRSQFKDAVREYAIQNGKDIFFKKNEPTRVRAKCGGVNCPWELSKEAEKEIPQNEPNEAPTDPREYSRNVNPEINQYVSSANRDSSLQPATTQAEIAVFPTLLWLHSETAGIVNVLFLVIGMVAGSVVSWFWVI
ncbi:hypothetical protein G4B88_013575 [Cannabis sativa]|uniref:Transposase MuDR plant domain-containing protein n=1 Tax=Cannabis sativa TaxID=3483 RepID=A0A7J6F8H0_CANSA|nr:hypothetical protein G4B88_013575 [Cannabis sativa]